MIQEKEGIKVRQLIINDITDQVRCALLENNQVKEIHQTLSYEDEMIGNIYIGRVTKVLPGMQAAFIDLGTGQNGYLHRNDLVQFQHQKASPSAKSSISHYIREGEQLIVQVVKEGDDHKGPKLTTNIEFSGNFLVYMPYSNYMAVSKKVAVEEERKRLLEIAEDIKADNEGLLFRTASKEQSVETLKAEYQSLKSQYEQLLKVKSKKPTCIYQLNSFIDRIIHDLGISAKDYIICDNFEQTQKLKEQYPNYTISYHEQKEGIFTTYKIEQEIEKLLKQVVWLKNGAYIVIEQTEAMTIIDVNTGKFSGKISMRDTVLKTNQFAAKEIARQIRLRNLSGIILIDFIDMKHKADQEVVLRTIIEEMKSDRVQHKILGFTELNILQITRKKTRKPLEAVLTTECPICKGTGRIISVESVAYRLERELWEYQFMDEEAMWIEATSDVISLVQGENGEHIRQLEEALKYKVIFSAIDSSSPCYHIKYLGSKKTIENRVSII